MQRQLTLEDSAKDTERLGTKTGKTTLIANSQMNMSVFGYVSGMEKKDHSDLITPITVCHLLM